jgi:hypothetical protein
MSSSSNITVKNIISSFTKSPTKIDGKPTYQTLKDLKDTLIENAASIDSARSVRHPPILVKFTPIKPVIFLSRHDKATSTS